MSSNALRSSLLVGGSLLVAAACSATTPGARPHDMSVAHHETMAGQDDRAAAGHARQYDPAAERTRERCRRLARDVSDREPICWTSVWNPTVEHRKDAARHRKMAADHREGAQALRDAEATACKGVADEDRDTSPFYHREDIVRVEAVPAAERGAPAGVTVVFRSVPGLTAATLQRVLECHAARSASLGHQVLGMEYCPLVLHGVTSQVTGTDRELAVILRSPDPAIADEMNRRVWALAPR